MSVETYNKEQERMLKHKIGEDLFEVLARMNEDKMYGMETVRQGPSKMELSSLSKDGIRSKDRKKNAKPRPGNNTLPYSY